MIMTLPLRKCALTTHVTLSVGWVGAVIAYLALAVTALTTVREQTLLAAYPMMEMIGWSVLVPLSVGAPLTGLGPAARHRVGALHVAGGGMRVH